MTDKEIKQQELLRNLRREIAVYVTSDIQDRWHEFLEVFSEEYEDLDELYDEVPHAFFTMLKLLEMDLSTLVAQNI